MRRIKNYIVIVINVLIASCQFSNDCSESIRIGNSNSAVSDVFLEIKTSQKDGFHSIFSEKIYRKLEINSQYGGGFPRVLTAKNKQIFQEIYVPIGSRCDTTKLDTIKSLFFKIPQRDTSWVNFEMQYSTCYNLQLLERYHYKNKLILARNNIILEQELITNSRYKNIYTVSMQDTNLLKIEYMRNGSSVTFIPKKCSKELFLKMLRTP